MRGRGGCGRRRHQGDGEEERDERWGGVSGAERRPATGGGCGLLHRSLLLVGSSSRSEVGSWGGGVLDHQDAISRPSGTADDAAPAGRATRGSRRTPAPNRWARSVTSSKCATST